MELRVKLFISYRMHLSKDILTYGFKRNALIAYSNVLGRSTYSPSNYNPGLRRSLSITAYPPTHRSCFGDSTFRSIIDTPHEERRVSTCRPNVRRDRPMTTMPRRRVNIYDDKENENPNSRSHLPGLLAFLANI